MKSKVFKFGLGSFFIVLMLVTALFLLRPIYNALNSTLNQIKDKYLTLLDEKFNLKLSINSISPNILTRLKISDIQILDGTTNQPIISVDSVIVRYKLKALFLKSEDARLLDLSFIQDFLTSITVNKTKITWNSESNASVLERILSLSDSSKDLSNEQNQKKVIENEKKLFKFSIPCKITLKNTEFQFSHKDIVATLKLPNIKLLQKNGDNVATGIDFNGNVNLFLPIKTLDSPLEISSGLRLQAVVSEDLEGSIARFQLTSANGDKFSLNGLDFAADFSDDVFSCKVFSAGVPFSIFCGFDTKIHNLEVALNAKRFDPFDFITLKDKKSPVNKALGSYLSGSYKVSYGLDSKDLTYFANGALHVSDKLFAGGIDASYNVFGTLAKVSVNNLVCTSPMFDFDFTGSFDIKNLSPQGEIFINRVALPSGKDLSAEIYVDRLSKGFICFIPQLIAGEDFLTALQLTCIPQKGSLDFAFEAYDYSHFESENPGKIAASGSVLFEEKTFLQTSVSLESVFLSGILKYASNFMKNPESLENLSKGFLSPYIMTLDLYASTDFSTVSYNLPYAVVANTQKDDEMLLLSLDGNETTVQVSRLDITAFGQEFTSTISADTDNKYKEVFFSSNFTLNSLPYSLYGAFAAGESLVLSGDYGFNFSMDFSSKEVLQGLLEIESLPINIFDYLITIETAADFRFSDLENWIVNLNSLRLIEESNKFKNSPTIDLSARIDPIGIQIDSVAYGDSISVLEGIGSINWNLQKGILDSASVLLEVASESTKEKISVDISASNPFLESFSSSAFAENFYLTGQIGIENLLAGHILDSQEDNSLSLNVSLLGPINNLFITADILDAAVKLGKNYMNLRGTVVLEDKTIYSSDINMDFGGIKVSNINFDFGLKDFSGKLLGDFDFTSRFISAKTPFELTFTPFTPGKLSSFMADLNLKKLESTATKTIENYHLRVFKTPAGYDFTGGTKESIVGYFRNSGELYASITGEFPVLLTAQGSIKNNQFDIYLDNIKADIKNIGPIIALSQFTMKSGLLEGNFHLGGLLSDPEFTGDFVVNDFVIAVPDYVAVDLTGKTVNIQARDNSFVIDDALFTHGKSQVGLDLEVLFDRWAFEELFIHVKTLNKTLVPAACIVPFLDIKANAACDLEMFLTTNSFSITGNVDTQDTIAYLSLGGSDDESDSREEKKRDFTVKMDLTVNIAPKSKLFYPNQENPIIRGLVSANKPLHLVLDDSGFSITGDLSVKGGEILYLSRNFYLKEGRIVFDESAGNFDPTITFRAEIPERDEYGDVIKIILEADSQKLSNFNPILTSNPLRSDEEIRTLLGQAFLGDTVTSVGQAVGQLAVSGIDYLIQNSVFRQIENRLRDLLNFDIFSFRTQFFQQAFKQAFFSSSDNPNEETPESGEEQTKVLNAGNFFDNTTVYIGKYIGNTIYMDAMFSLIYKQDPEKLDEGKLVLQPELGLELPTPFVNIRWSIAPDITSAQNLWVPYTSISLSWKFTF